MSLICLAVVLVVCAAMPVAAQEVIKLPDPGRHPDISLEAALSRVQTSRGYGSSPLSQGDLSYALFAAGGGRYDAVSSATRSYPSASMLYPLRVYLMVGSVEGISPGCYAYNSFRHELKRTRTGDLRREAVEGSGYASFVALAPATIVIAADLEAAGTYNKEHGKLVHVPMEVGHLSQNIRLAATAAGLAVGIADLFSRDKVKALLGLEEEPIMMVTLGSPK